jgi:hypothetical protein
MIKKTAFKFYLMLLFFQASVYEYEMKAPELLH